MTSTRSPATPARSPQGSQAARWLRAAAALPALIALCPPGCASSPAGGAAAATPSAAAAATPVTPTALPPALLRGARCQPGAAACACRKPGDNAESDPPGPGMKRLEVRLSFLGGEGSLSSPNLGRMPAAGVHETCYYVDVPATSHSAIRFEGHASNEVAGFTPHLAIAEYGPQGAFWYEVLTVDCVGVGGRCDSAGTDAWTATLQGRKRGRMDPCGSMVVSALKWDTSGGLSHRDNGYYRDLEVSFDLEAKKFTPQFPPNSTECVPK